MLATRPLLLLRHVLILPVLAKYFRRILGNGGWIVDDILAIDDTTVFEVIKIVLGRSNAMVT